MQACYFGNPSDFRAHDYPLTRHHRERGARVKHPLRLVIWIYPLIYLSGVIDLTRINCFSFFVMIHPDKHARG